MFLKYTIDSCEDYSQWWRSNTTSIQTLSLSYSLIYIVFGIHYTSLSNNTIYSDIATTYLNNSGSQIRIRLVSAATVETNLPILYYTLGI